MSSRSSKSSRSNSPSCTSRSPAWLGVIAGVLAGAVLVVGCAKSKPSTEAPGEAAVADSAEAGAEPEAHRDVDDGLSAYLNELAGHEDAMLSIGLPLPGGVAQARTEEGRSSLPAGDGGGDAGARCERVCGLATNICELRDRICGLVDEHRNELRYHNACERASLDCEHATKACEGCDDG
jgi:hypothetical protein